jgi:hypothetical protein
LWQSLKKAPQSAALNAGLQWREQLLRRKNVSLLSLSLTLVHCGVDSSDGLGKWIDKKSWLLEMRRKKIKKQLDDL